MAGIDERDKILTKWMKEWDELGLDLVVTPASLMPAPLQVSFLMTNVRHGFCKPTLYFMSYMYTSRFAASL